jgi:hypothetical protein
MKPGPATETYAIVHSQPRIPLPRLPFCESRACYRQDTEARESRAPKWITGFGRGSAYVATIELSATLNAGFTLVNKWPAERRFCNRINWVEIVGF